MMAKTGLERYSSLDLLRKRDPKTRLFLRIQMPCLVEGR
jgi:hypothetical protein